MIIIFVILLDSYRFCFSMGKISERTMENTGWTCLFHHAVMRVTLYDVKYPIYTIYSTKIYRSRSWSADHFLIWSLITFYHFSRSRSWSDRRLLFNWSWSDFKITFSDHFFRTTCVFLSIIYSQIPNKVLGIVNRS